MSNPISYLPPANLSTATSSSDAPVAHHVHRDDEPLPGTRGAAPTVDYSPNTIQHAQLPPSEVGDTQDFHPSNSPHHETAHAHHDHCAHHPTSESHVPVHSAHCVHSEHEHHQAGVQPPIPGNVGTTENREFKSSSGPQYDVHGRPEGEPAGKVSLGDKVIGKTEQIAGKITGNAGLKEKGEARSHGL